MGVTSIRCILYSDALFAETSSLGSYGSYPLTAIYILGPRPTKQ